MDILTWTDDKMAKSFNIKDYLSYFSDFSIIKVYCEED